MLTNFKERKRRSIDTSCSKLYITYCSVCPGGKSILAIDVGLKSVCNHLFTKVVDQHSESASMKIKTEFIIRQLLIKVE